MRSDVAARVKLIAAVVFGIPVLWVIVGDSRMNAWADWFSRNPYRTALVPGLFILAAMSSTFSKRS